MGADIVIYPTSAGQEAAQNAAIAIPYPTVDLIESTAPTTQNFVFCLATQTTYQLVAIGSFTVDHINVLSVVGTVLYVWKAIDGILGPNVPIFTDSDEPLAAEVANLLWYNSTSGIYRYSNGTTKIDVSIGVNPAQDNGYTIILPNYMNVANGTTFQMNSTSKKIKIVFSGPIDFASFAASLYLSAIGAAGNVTATAYAADSSDTVVGDALGAVTFASGSSASAWIRHLWTAIQHHRDTRVAVVYSVASSVDVTVYGSRQLTPYDTGLYQGMNCYTTTDGSTWVAFTQDSRPAQFAWILNSSTNNAPQACYGRHLGSNVALFESGHWKNYSIPQEGVIFNIESGFTASDPLAGTLHPYSLYLHSAAGTLVLAGSATGRIEQDGQEVKSDALTYRFLGLFYGITRNSQVAMIDCLGGCSLWNVRARLKVFRRQPYGTTTTGTLTGGAAWRKFNGNDDFSIPFISGTSLIRMTNNGGAVTNYYLNISASIDGTDPDDRAVISGVYGGDAWGSVATLSKIVTEGIHVAHAVERGGSSNCSPTYWSDAGLYVVRTMSQLEYEG